MKPVEVRNFKLGDCWFDAAAAGSIQVKWRERDAVEGRSYWRPVLDVSPKDFQKFIEDLTNLHADSKAKWVELTRDHEQRLVKEAAELERKIGGLRAELAKLNQGEHDVPARHW